MSVRPAVILVTGTPGSGKTSVTTAVAEADDRRLLAYRPEVEFDELYRRVSLRSAGGTGHVLVHDEDLLRRVHERCRSGQASVNHLIRKLDSSLSIEEMRDRIVDDYQSDAD